MAAKTAVPIDADSQLIINQVRALVEYHVERQRAAGHEEVAQTRAALVAGIIEALRVRSPKP
jgi:hypothetical protein